MSIIGCDLHSRYQQIAMLEMETGEIVTRRLEHENGEAKAFYARLPKPALIGIEATGYTQWFERMLAEIGHELWIGDPAEIGARSVRKQVTDTRAAEHRRRAWSTRISRIRCAATPKKCDRFCQLGFP